MLQVAQWSKQAALSLSTGMASSVGSLCDCTQAGKEMCTMVQLINNFISLSS